MCKKKNIEQILNNLKDINNQNNQKNLNNNPLIECSAHSCSAANIMDQHESNASSASSPSGSLMIDEEHSPPPIAAAQSQQQEQMFTESSSESCESTGASAAHLITDSIGALQQQQLEEEEQSEVVVDPNNNNLMSMCPLDNNAHIDHMDEQDGPDQSQEENNDASIYRGLYPINQVKQHFRKTVKDKKNLYECLWPGCTFTTWKYSQHISRHIYLKHIGIKELVCNIMVNDKICGKMFKRPESLVQHKKNHKCGFGIDPSIMKDPNNVCGGKNIRRFFTRIADNEYHVFKCQFENCSFHTHNSGSIRRHVHNQHVCPYSAAGNAGNTSSSGQNNHRNNAQRSSTMAVSSNENEDGGMVLINHSNSSESSPSASSYSNTPMISHSILEVQLKESDEAYHIPNSTSPEQFHHLQQPQQDPKIVEEDEDEDDGGMLMMEQENEEDGQPQPEPEPQDMIMPQDLSCSSNGSAVNRLENKPTGNMNISNNGRYSLKNFRLNEDYCKVKISPNNSNQSSQTRFKCLHCEEVFEKQITIVRHLWEELKWKDFDCKSCGTHFNNEGSLYKHRKSEHINPNGQQQNNSINSINNSINSIHNSIISPDPPQPATASELGIQLQNLHLFWQIYGNQQQQSNNCLVRTLQQEEQDECSIISSNNSGFPNITNHTTAHHNLIQRLQQNPQAYNYLDADIPNFPSSTIPSESHRIMGNNMEQQQQTLPNLQHSKRMRVDATTSNVTHSKRMKCNESNELRDTEGDISDNGKNSPPPPTAAANSPSIRQASNKTRDNGGLYSLKKYAGRYRRTKREDATGYQYECTRCKDNGGYVTTAQASMVRHIWSHDPQDFTCPVCQESCENEFALYKHKKAKHPDMTSQHHRTKPSTTTQNATHQMPNKKIQQNVQSKAIENVHQQANVSPLIELSMLQQTCPETAPIWPDFYFNQPFSTNSTSETSNPIGQLHSTSHTSHNNQTSRRNLRFKKYKFQPNPDQSDTLPDEDHDEEDTA